jgi:hypothetical protein
LLHNKQFCENMNEAASAFRELVGEIRRDPRQYLNVRVSIFKKSVAPGRECSGDPPG